MHESHPTTTPQAVIASPLPHAVGIGSSTARGATACKKVKPTKKVKQTNTTYLKKNQNDQNEAKKKNRPKVRALRVHAPRPRHPPTPSFQSPTYPAMSGPWPFRSYKHSSDARTARKNGLNSNKRVGLWHRKKKIAALELLSIFFAIFFFCSQMLSPQNSQPGSSCQAVTRLFQTCYASGPPVQRVVPVW